jgi:hypothetical protein
MGEAMSDETSPGFSKWIVGVILASIVVALTYKFGPGIIPYTTEQIWDTHGTRLTNWLYSGKYLFAWGVGVNVIYHLVRKEDLLTWFYQRVVSRGSILARGLVVSTLAGVLEEITYRWLYFLCAFPVLTLLNYLLLGFMDYGLLELLSVYVMAPVADFTTLGYLSAYLDDPNWLVGGAMLGANALFRDEHRYQGLIGYVNSWFIGMAMFYFMFTYGLMAAIVIHFTYDMLIFIVSAIFHRKKPLSDLLK